MKLEPTLPPREFEVGWGERITLKDCGRLALGPNEMITFVTEAGGEYDVVRKNWGFYATPSTNDRLRRNGFRAALARSSTNRLYIFLMEQGKEQEFERYLGLEQHEVVAWLDTDDSIAHLQRSLARSGRHPRTCLCGGSTFSPVFTYDAPPAGEPRYAFSRGDYQRAIVGCTQCGHFLAVHDMDLSAAYSGDYVSSTYGDDGILRAFERIISLDPSRSDNAGRVRRVIAFADTHLAQRAEAPSILDVGSGLCVFLHGMKAAGWSCTALDPDRRSVQHAAGVVGVRALHGDVMTTEIDATFDVVTLNKVLEHATDPVAMLTRAARHVKSGGFIYVEVPDGERASVDGAAREEFFVDHRHVFSAASVGILAARSRLTLSVLERLQEPSGKYTLLAFLTPVVGS